MSDRKLLPGKFVWFELVCKEADRARAKAFYAEVLGWKAQPFSMGDATSEMIYAGETMIGGYATTRSESQPAHWLAYVSVDDVDAAAKAATANGGRVVEPPADVPNAGRMARIADAQGAEISLFKSAMGDPADVPIAGHGRWLWNELHTSDPTKALAFYEKVVGFSHQSMEMGPGGTYHTLSKGGVDRGGVTGHLAAGAPPHWLPYVSVDDVDAAIARARKLGATIPVGPEEIPGIGRFGVFIDPTGAVLAIMKPLPRSKGATTAHEEIVAASQTE